MPAFLSGVDDIDREQVQIGRGVSDSRPAQSEPAGTVFLARPTTLCGGLQLEKTRRTLTPAAPDPTNPPPLTIGIRWRADSLGRAVPCGEDAPSPARSVRRHLPGEIDVQLSDQRIELSAVLPEHVSFDRDRTKFWSLVQRLHTHMVTHGPGP